MISPTPTFNNHAFFLATIAIFTIILVNGASSQKNPSLCAKRLPDIRNTNAPKLADNTAKRENFPWHVSIFRRATSQSPFAYKCGGTLIAPLGIGQELMVVTAAHCVTKPSSDEAETNYDTIRVVVGPSSSNMNGNSDRTGSQKHYVKHIEINPNYQFNGLRSDIALIQLRNKVKPTKYSIPVCFQTALTKSEEVRLSPGVTAEIGGFGWDTQRNISTVLRYADMRIVSTSLCQESHQKKINKFLEFCAGYQHDSNIFCKSDSGGGLVVEYPKESGQYILQGVLSSTAVEDPSTLSGECVNYNLFTRMTPFSDWAQQVQERLLKEANPPSTVAPPKDKAPLFTTVPGTPTVSPIILSPPEYMRVAMEMNNHYRQRHSAPPVKLNEQMRSDAQNFAVELAASDSDSLEEPAGKSEYSTILFSIPGALPPVDAVREAMQFWYRTSVDYDRYDPTPSAFTQLVWKSSSQMGIGVATNGDRTIVVANYWPQGNKYYTAGRRGERDKWFHENVRPPIKGF